MLHSRGSASVTSRAITNDRACAESPISHGFSADPDGRAVVPMSNPNNRICRAAVRSSQHPPPPASTPCEQARNQVAPELVSIAWDLERERPPRRPTRYNAPAPEPLPAPTAWFYESSHRAQYIVGRKVNYHI